MHDDEYAPPTPAPSLPDVGLLLPPLPLLLLLLLLLHLPLQLPLALLLPLLMLLLCFLLLLFATSIATQVPTIVRAVSSHPRAKVSPLQEGGLPEEGNRTRLVLK